MITKRRRSIRLKEFDYSQPGSYFVTIVSHQRKCIFGEVVDGEVQLSTARTIVDEMLHGISERFPNVAVDLFVVMPNHVHAILNVGAQFIAPGGSGEAGAMNRAPTLGQIIRSVKSASTHRILRVTQIENVWQRDFYEHVIRNEQSLQRIRQYILDNPVGWEFDPENPAATKPERSDAWRVP
jgi:putative transposase